MGDGEDTRVTAASRPSVPDLFARLIADAREWVRAEIALIKCRGEALIESLRTAVILIVAAVMLATVALFALAIGLILALATFVGPAWATVIVVVSLLLLAAILGWMGWQRIEAVFEDKP
jgi:hypothetical protein